MRSKLAIAISTSAGIVLAIVIGVFVFVSGDEAASAQAPGGGGGGGSYMWSYATKFVCGTESPNPAGTIGEPPVKPGNYATDINIHNYNYRDAILFKKMIILVGETIATATHPGGPFVGREPVVTAPSAFVTLTLPPDFATMDDCVALTNLAKQSGAIGAGSFMMGYLVVLSGLDIDVDAVYTAEVYGVGSNGVANPAGIAEDLLHVAGKRVFVPGGVLPGGNPGADVADGH